MEQWNNLPFSGHSSQKALLLKISGRVQGVFFRAETKRKAEELELTGWVCNCDDGSVKIFAQGSEKALEKLEAWCGKGPPAASVLNVQRMEVSPEDHRGFEIR